MVSGDVRDAPREVDVLLGHPLDDVLGAFVVPIDGVVADQPEVDVAGADRHDRVMPKLIAGLTNGDDKACAGGEFADPIAGVEALGQLAPVGEVGLGDLLAAHHVHEQTLAMAQ